MAFNYFQPYFPPPLPVPCVLLICCPGLLLVLLRTGNKSRFDSITISEHSDSWCDLDLVLRNFGGLRGEIVGVDSCNGLLATAVLDSYDGHMEFRVYNLIARRLRLIPMFQDTPQAKASEILGLSIVFDPLISGHYKLMCIWWLQEKKKYGFTVYSSQTRSWRKIKASQEVHKRKFCFKKGVLWRDRLHWIGAGDGDGDGCPKTFVWLDLNKYQFYLKMPALCSNQKLMYFGESRGRLYIVELNTSRESFDVFEFIEVRNRKIDEVMEDEEEECTKWDFKYHIDLTAMMLDKKNYDEWSILSFMAGDRENKSRVLLLVPGELILYDINDMTIKKRSTIGCVLRHGSCCSQWNEVYNSHDMIVASGWLVCNMFLKISSGSVDSIVACPQVVLGIFIQKISTFFSTLNCFILFFTFPLFGISLGSCIDAYCSF